MTPYKLPVKDWYFIIVCAGSLITNGLVPGSSHHIPWAHTHTAPHPTKKQKSKDLKPKTQSCPYTKNLTLCITNNNELKTVPLVAENQNIACKDNLYIFCTRKQTYKARQTQIHFGKFPPGPNCVYYATATIPGFNPCLWCSDKIQMARAYPTRNWSVFVRR